MRCAMRIPPVPALALLLLLPGIDVAGQTIPPDRDDLLSGRGTDPEFTADPIDVPGPKQILDLADTLRLSEEQIKQIEAIADAAAAEARALGIRIIEQEERLEELFRTGTAREQETRAVAVEIGTLRGRLRAVYLAAHLQAADLLTRRQRGLIAALRAGGRTTAGRLNAPGPGR